MPKIKQTDFLRNAACYLDIFRIWATYPDAPPFVSVAIDALEEIHKFSDPDVLDKYQPYLAEILV